MASTFLLFVFIFLAKRYSQLQSDYLLFAVKGSECSNSWLLKILRINYCWVLSTERGFMLCPLRSREHHTRGDRKNAGAYDVEERCKMLSSAHYRPNTAIKLHISCCLHWGLNKTGPINSQLSVGRDSQGATVSQEL